MGAAVFRPNVGRDAPRGFCLAPTDRMETTPLLRMGPGARGIENHLRSLLDVPAIGLSFDPSFAVATLCYLGDGGIGQNGVVERWATRRGGFARRHRVCGMGGCGGLPRRVAFCGEIARGVGLCAWVRRRKGLRSQRSCGVSALTCMEVSAASCGSGASVAYLRGDCCCISCRASL